MFSGSFLGILGTLSEFYDLSSTGCHGPLCAWYPFIGFLFGLLILLSPANLFLLLAFFWPKVRGWKFAALIFAVFAAYAYSGLIFIEGLDTTGYGPNVWASLELWAIPVWTVALVGWYLEHRSNTAASDNTPGPSGLSENDLREGAPFA